MNNTKTLKNINGLKALALIVIFYQHIGFWINHLDQRACDILFMLSGFLIAYHYWNTDTFEISGLKYLYKKFLQLYPLHIICFVICAFFIYQWDAISKRENIILAFLNLTLTQSWFNYEECYYSFNAVTWFLSSLMVVYAIAPTLLKIMKKIKPNMFFLLLLCIFCVRLCLEICNGILFSVNLFCNPIFSVFTTISGMCIFPLANKFQMFMHEKNSKIYTILFSIVEISTMALLCASTIKYYAQWRTTYFIIIIWIFLYFISFNKGILSKFFSLPFWNFISKVQFEFFMVHWLVIRLLEPYLNMILLIIVSFIISYTISYLYHNYLVSAQQIFSNS